MVCHHFFFLFVNESVVKLNHFFSQISNASLARSIENATQPLSPTDPDLLLLKAISSATTHCLLQCLGLLQRHHEIQDRNTESSF